MMTTEDTDKIAARIDALEDDVKDVVNGLKMLKDHIHATEANRIARNARWAKRVGALIGIFIALPTSVQGTISVVRALENTPVHVSNPVTVTTHTQTHP